MMLFEKKPPVVLMGALLGCAITVAHAQTSVSLRDLQQLENERERAEQRRELEAMRERAPKTAEERVTRTQLPQGDFQFVLTKVSHTASEVLTDEEIAKAVSPWIDRVVRVNDLAALVDAINQLYRDKGYAVCQAALRPQRIRQGHLTVTLIEGKTDEVVIRGLENTNEGYVARAFDLEVGKVANYRDMYNNLVRFNMTNDIHLSVDIHAGDQPETSRYVISAQEPAQWTASVFADSLGSENTGQYRLGASIANRSVFGWRDSMYLYGVASEGSKSLLWGYSVPLDSFGTRLIANASVGDVEVIDGPNEPYDVSGRSYMGSLRLEHPFAITETSKQIGFLQYQYEASQTDMFKDLTIAKTQIDHVDMGVESLFLGDQWSMFINNRVSHHWANEKLFGNRYEYWIYSGDGFAQLLLTQHLSMNVTAGWQAKFSGDPMVSSDQFYLGHTSGVRGYPNDVLSADNGIWLNWEGHYRWHPRFDTFVFADLGRLSGVSAYEKDELYSAGLGLDWRPWDWAQLKATMAMPLTKQITETEKVDKVRFDASLTLVY